MFGTSNVRCIALSVIDVCDRNIYKVNFMRNYCKEIKSSRNCFKIRKKLLRGVCRRGPPSLDEKCNSEVYLPINIGGVTSQLFIED